MCKKHIHTNEKHAWETFLATIPIGFSCRHLGGVSILTMRNIGVLVLGELEGESGTKVD